MVFHGQLSALAFMVLSTLVLAASAPGEVFRVTTTADDDGPCEPDDCALREAVLAANALPGMDMILVPPGEYNLPSKGHHLADAASR